MKFGIFQECDFNTNFVGVRCMVCWKDVNSLPLASALFGRMGAEEDTAAGTPIQWHQNLPSGPENKS